MTNTFIDYTIGADPEFAISYDDNLVYGDRFFNAIQGGDYDEDDPCVERGEDELNSFGLDGGDVVIEIRPQYAYRPIDLVSNIRQSMIKSVVEDPHWVGVDWFAGPFAYNQPMGGHIHFGIDRRIWDQRKLTQALAVFATTLFANFELDHLAVRRKRNYGQPADSRSQPWGMEFRALSSWLESPMTSLAAISLCKHIVNQSVIDPEFYNMIYENCEKITGKKYDQLLTDVREHNSEVLSEVSPKLWQEITRWETHNDVKQGLIALDAMLSSGFKMKSKVDFKENWGIGAKLVQI